MKKLALSCLIVIAGLTAALATVHYTAPGWIFDGAMQATRLAAGMDSASVEIDGYEIAYLDNGQTDKPTILMVHGFGAEKDNWTRMALFLQEDYRLVALDQLGHGESAKPMDASYRISDQAARLYQFTEALGLDQVHLIGNSMGGHISGFFAARYPEKVASITFLNNGGIISPEPSDLWKEIQQGRNPLIISKPEDAETFFKFIFVEPPFITEPVLEYFAERGMARKPMNDLIFSHIKDENFENLADELPNIQAPVQIIWGDSDRILHVSSIEKMVPLLDQPKVVIMPETGHGPMMERPEQTAHHLRSFIENL